MSEAPAKLSAIQSENMLACFLHHGADLEMVRVMAAELNWSTRRCGKGGIAEAERLLLSEGSPKAIILDISRSPDPLEELKKLLELCPEHVQVIAAGEINDVRFYRSLLDLGVSDYLTLPLKPWHVHESLGRVDRAEAGALDSDGNPHRSIVAIGVRGGLGASTLACGLAWLASEEFGRRTALLDLDLQFGTGALAFDMEPGLGLSSSFEDPTLIKASYLEHALVPVSDHLSILASEATLLVDPPASNVSQAFARSRDCLEAAFDVSIIDLPRHRLNDASIMLQSVSDTIVVAALTLAATRDTIRILSWLKARQRHDRVWLVVARRSETGEELSIKDFEASVERSLDCILPFDPDGAATAAKLGRSIVKESLKSEVRKPLLPLANMLLNPGESEPVRPMSIGKAIFQGIGGLASHARNVVAPSRR